MSNALEEITGIPIDIISTGPLIAKEKNALYCATLDA